MRILVVGTGYVGLVSGACFAEKGHDVICLDIDQHKIQGLKEGIIPIYEPGLEEMVKRNIQANRLKFTTDYEYGVKNSLFCFIAVSTPTTEDGSADLNYVKQAAASIAACMDDYKVIVNKSTVPVGTAKMVESIISSNLKVRNQSISFDVVSNPEFLKEGDAIQDFLVPDRIVIGTENAKAASLMQELYAPLNVDPKALLIMDTASAEITKYAANAMLACRISFMNEIAGLCESLGADICDVKRGIGSDQRIGSAFLNAGAGYGGSCFPKDIKALIATAETQGYETPLLNAVEAVNAKQKLVIGHKIENYFASLGGLEGKKIALWGLAFKPGTDDMREAPSLVLIRHLLEKGAYVRLFDPVAMKKAKQLIKKSPQILFCKDEIEAVRDTDALALMTEWPQFLSQDLKVILSNMKGKAFFDGRNQFKPQQMAALGWDYFSIGQKSLSTSLESWV